MTPFEIFEKKWEFWSKRREINGGFFSWFCHIDTDCEIRKNDNRKKSHFYKHYHLIYFKKYKIEYFEDDIHITERDSGRTLNYEQFTKELNAKRIREEINNWIDTGVSEEDT